MVTISTPSAFASGFLVIGNAPLIASVSDFLNKWKSEGERREGEGREGVYKGTIIINIRLCLNLWNSSLLSTWMCFTSVR